MRAKVSWALSPPKERDHPSVCAPGTADRAKGVVEEPTNPNAPAVAPGAINDASDTLGGATSADVNTGLGKPGSGETAAERHHQGSDPHTGRYTGSTMLGQDKRLPDEPEGH